MRWKLTAAVVAGVALAPAAPASAGTLSIQNSCRWSIDGVWRHQDVELTGSAAPAPVAPGSGLALTRTSIRSRIPAYIVEIGFNAGLLKAGENELPAKVWAALAASGTVQGIQVRELEATGRTTITTNPDGSFQSATPIDVTVPIPDTAWTAGTAAIGFRQGPAGSLPQIPAGVAGAMVTPLGSAYISATMGGGTRVQLDCQPATGEGSTPPTPFNAGAFETVAIDVGAPVVPAPAARPQVSVRSTKLRASGRRVSLALSCAGAPCRGAVTVRAGSMSVTRRVTYSLAAGARKTIKLTLSAKGRALLRKRSVSVRVAVTTASGSTATKRFRLSASRPVHATAAAARRVVAIEWDTVENLHMLGTAPVGAADMKGYDTWVAAPRPRGMKDIGSRQSPSLERIAALRPDLIVVPDHRATRNLSQLKRIAPVLVTHPYPARGSQLSAMVTDFRRLAAAVGKQRRGEDVLQALSNTLAREKGRLRRARRAGASVAIATPGGTTSAPAIRMFTTNSATADVVRRLGLRDGWSGSARYGFATVGLEGLSRVRGWLAFVYPPQYARQVAGITRQNAYKRLPVVRAKRVRTLGGTTWLFGGPRSTMLFAERLTAALT